MFAPLTIFSPYTAFLAVPQRRREEWTGALQDSPLAVRQGADKRGPALPGAGIQNDRAGGARTAGEPVQGKGDTAAGEGGEVSFPGWPGMAQRGGFRMIFM